MNPTEEIILRKYLKRRIAEQNAKFSKMTYRFQEEAKTLRMNAFANFARGAVSTFSVTPSNLDYKEARQHIRESGNRMSPYNYFDLDTLIAYDAYWDEIFRRVYISCRERKHQYADVKDFDTAISYTVPRWLIDNAHKKESGYYNVERPVTIMRDERGRPLCEKTPEAKSFESKYSMPYCEELLDRYLSEKHGEKISTLIIDEEDPEQSEPREVEYITYKGKKFLIMDERLFHDENMFTIRYIMAKSIDGYLTMMGYFDMEDCEYVGDLYDDEGNFVHDRSETGVSLIKTPREMQ